MCCSDEPGPELETFTIRGYMSSSMCRNIPNWSMVSQRFNKTTYILVVASTRLKNYQPNFFSMHFGLQNFKKKLSFAVHSLLINVLIVLRLQVLECWPSVISSLSTCNLKSQTVSKLDHGFHCWHAIRKHKVWGPHVMVHSSSLDTYIWVVGS